MVAVTVPAVLDRYLSHLQAFGEGTRGVLGPWLGPLAALVGPPVERRSADPIAPPRGWSGLSNRGPYDRLIASEWLLADELPDEFLRRATSGEHLFVELDRVTEVQAQRTVVLFDVGPDQLGAPRLVHLALLVVLTARAADQQLSVGVLQGSELFEPALAPEVGRALGAAPTRTLPARNHAEDWARRLAEAGATELWVVGGPSALTLPFDRAERVLVTEEWRTGGLRVVRRGQGPQAEVSLPPPPPSAGIVLADPFSPASRVAGAVEHVAAAYGASQWLLLRIRSGGQDRLVALATPDTARARARGLATRVIPGWSLVAAGRTRQQAVSVWHRDGELLADGMSGGGRMPQPAGFVVDREGPLSALFGSRHLLVLPDAGGRLWELDFVIGRATALGRYEGALWYTPPGVIWFESKDKMSLWRDGSVRRVDAPKVPWTPWVEGEGVARVHGAMHEVAARRWGRWEPLRLPIGDSGLLYPAWFPRKKVFVGCGDGVLWSLAVSDAALERVQVKPNVIELGPEPVAWAGADPGGHAYAVVTATRVRFFEPTEGQLLLTWAVE